MSFNNNESVFASARSDKAAAATSKNNYLAIVLAGGSKLPNKKSLPAEIRGRRPVHFSSKQDSDVFINKTREQIEKAFAKYETMFVVTDNYSGGEKYLQDLTPEHMIVQPQDKGTTVAVLYAALHLAVKKPSAVLAFFPADFYAPDAAEFMRRVETACDFASRDPNLLLLGVEPDGAKTAREWIEPDLSAAVDKNFGVWRVRRFAAQTRRLSGNGALINSSVMVGTPTIFLKSIRDAAPGIYESFTLAAERVGTVNEKAAVRAAYRLQHAYTDFSWDVLEKIAGKLMVVPVPPSLKSAVGIEPKPAKSLPETFSVSAQKFYVARLGA